MAQSFIDAATTSATAGSSGSPRSIVRSRLRYTSLGSRCRIMLREKMSLPKMASIRSAWVMPPFRERAGVVTGAWASCRRDERERSGNPSGDPSRRGQRIFDIGDVGIGELGVHRVGQIALAEVCHDGDD